MALHPSFPRSPYAIVDPSLRWFPADELLRETKAAQLIAPLVTRIRDNVARWRAAEYSGATNTSKALLNWWFENDHWVNSTSGEYNFRYYFGQREAVETVIWLYEVAKARDKYDLMRYDSSGAVSAGMFAEDWTRYVTKMATGSGKTKVLSLLIAWSYFHRLYEPESALSKNFLVIAPNIIVLERLRTDFDGLRVFFEDPVLPYDGFEGANWVSDFQPTLHIQDELRPISATGNIFLTNIHRIYEGATEAASFDDEDTMDYFLGARPVANTTDSLVDLGDIVRNVDELIVMNDEAHHLHDPRMAWFKSIEDIHNKMLMKGGRLSLQIDLTATPRHDNGGIFVQTVSDYALVEAIYQDVVKHPVVPDAASRSKLQERPSSKFTEKYHDYLALGFEEWRKVFEEHERVGKKAVLFVMTDDTKNCDEVAEYLENLHPELAGGVLVIHTKNNGEISESGSSKNKDELERLRRASNEIDSWDSPYKAIVSVLMLKEGWDVRNVTTIVGLRAYSSGSNILPEQTLGRGLRKMYPGTNVSEVVSVVGTEAFMDFVDQIKVEGVELEHRPMGSGNAATGPLVIEIDRENKKKDLEELEIEIPNLTARIHREYKNLSDLDVSTLGHKIVGYREFSDAEQRQIVFRDISNNEVSHETVLDAVHIDSTGLVGHFANQIQKELRLFGSYDVLYGKVKEFISRYLFNHAVDLGDLNTVRNLSELEASKTIFETFKKAINELTVRDRGEAQIKDYIKVGDSRPFVASYQPFMVAKRSPFNRVIGDLGFELEFAAFLEGCDDVSSFTKNYFQIHFKIDYQRSDGSISDYYPDFIVKLSPSEYCVVETKGREEVNDLEKIKRLKLWCQDVNVAQSRLKYSMLYIKQNDWDALERQPDSFSEAVRLFEDPT